MASFHEICFTPAEFARIAKIDRALIPMLEQEGLVEITRRRVGNVDRKIITLESVQNYFQFLRQLMNDGVLDAALAEHAMAGEGAIAGGTQTPVEVIEKATGINPLVAAATAVNLGTPKHKVQMFYNVKGGTGKSTLTSQFVMRAAMMGYKILAVDLDGQGHLTVNLDFLDGHQNGTIYDVLINELPMKDAIVNIAPNLDLIPANLGLCNIEIPLNHKPRREYRLEEAIASVAHQYDLIVADTNPAASILNCSMMVASDLVNVICATNPLSFHGMSLVMSTIEEMKREFRREMNVRIIPNMYDAREVISQEVLGELQTEFSEFCASTVVHRTADLNEATKRRTTVWDVNAKGTAADDISKLTEELLFV
jgi:chromosome partitioning protein